LIKIAIYLSLGLLKGRISYRRSLQPSEKNIQLFDSYTGNICSFVTNQNKIKINFEIDMDVGS
jgi:hypothetical protein